MVRVLIRIVALLLVSSVLLSCTHVPHKRTVAATALALAFDPTSSHDASWTLDHKIQLWNTIGTWLASLGTLASVIVALFLARQSALAAQEPNIQVHINQNPNDAMYDFIGFELENTGPGDAYLFPLRFYINNEFIGTNLRSDKERAAQKMPGKVHTMTNHGTAILAAGQRRKILWIDREQYDTPDARILSTLVPAITFVGFYSGKFGYTRLLVEDRGENLNPKEIRRKYGIPRRLKLVRE